MSSNTFVVLLSDATLLMLLKGTSHIANQYFSTSILLISESCHLYASSSNKPDLLASISIISVIGASTEKASLANPYLCPITAHLYIVDTLSLLSLNSCVL